MTITSEDRFTLFAEFAEFLDVPSSKIHEYRGWVRRGKPVKPEVFTVGLIKPGMPEDFILIVKHRCALVGLRVNALPSFTWDDDAQVSEFYPGNEGKAWYYDFVEYMTSGPITPVIITGTDAVVKWRGIMGATDPASAAPGTLRGDYAPKDGVIAHNAVHGSDSTHNAEREMYLLEGYLVGLI